MAAFQVALTVLLPSPGHAVDNCPPFVQDNSASEIIARHMPQSGPLSVPQLNELFKELVREKVIPPLSVRPSSGPAPLTVEIGWLIAPMGDPAEIEFDVDGDGNPEWSQKVFRLESERREHTYRQEGEYQFTVRIHDRSGKITVYAIPVTVLSPSEFHAEIKARWSGFKAALHHGDVSAALECIAVSSRDRYRPVLQKLGGNLPSISTNLGDLHVTRVKDGLAEATTVRLQDGQRRLYFIYFMPDPDGIWRIQTF